MKVIYDDQANIPSQYHLQSSSVISPRTTSNFFDLINTCGLSSEILDDTDKARVAEHGYGS